MKVINKDYLLAVDQGTSGSRAFIFNAKGDVVQSAYQEFRQYYPKPGLVEHDANEIWQSVQTVIQRAIKDIDPNRIKAIGITNQRETTILWDKKTGKPLHKAIVWQDRRTSDMCGMTKLTQHRAFITATTGLKLDPYFCATKIKWLLSHVPHIAKKVKASQVCFGTVDAWLIYQLTGKVVHATDMTNASRTLLFNIRTKKWDDRLLKIFGVPRSLLPQVFPSGYRFGVTVEIAGLPKGIPITAVMGDQQAALYGQGCFETGTVKNTYGTGCFMVLNTGKKLRTSRKGLLTTIACDVQGLPVYALEGAVFIAGAAVQWLRDELKAIKRSTDTESCIAKTKDNAGVYFVPAFVGLGAPYWNPTARGVICGLTRGANVNHIVRAAVEAMAYQTKDIFDLMCQESGLSIKRIAVDGGACQNSFLLQLQADLLNAVVVRPKQIDSTVWGVAQLAGLKVNFWKPKDLKAMQKIEKMFYPTMTKKNVQMLYSGWQQAVKRTL